jgi:hypothetical protein
MASVGRPGVTEGSLSICTFPFFSTKIRILLAADMVGEFGLPLFSLGYGHACLPAISKPCALYCAPLASNSYSKLRNFNH